MWTAYPQGFDAVIEMGPIRLASQEARACGIWVQAPGEPTGYEVMWTCSTADREADPDVCLQALPPLRTSLDPISLI